MGNIIILMLLGATVPIVVLGLATLVASTYNNYIQKRNQNELHPLLGFVAPKEEKRKPNA